MAFRVRGLCKELFRLLVIAALVFTAIGTRGAIADPTWTQTTQSDFESGTLSQVDTSSSPGDVKLAKVGMAGDYVYALRGGDTDEFWQYSISSNSWTSKADTLGNVYDGGALTYDGNNYIYALRGDDSKSFWRYNISTNSWVSLQNTPRNVNEGGALVYDGNSYIYALRGGGRNSFWRYDITYDTWSWKASTPCAVYGGGALTYDGSRYIYALQGHSNLFWRYDTWYNYWTWLTSTPSSVGDGGALTWDGNYVYALRGDGEDDFWRYDTSANSWTSKADTPSTPCVYGGGALTCDGSNYIYALHGDGEDDFWRYDISADSWTSKTDTPQNVAYGGALTMSGTSYHSSGNLTSSTHDTGFSADFGSISWTATTPAGTSVKFQIATNNDNSTWNFKGPDGTSGTYYTSSGTGIWTGHDNDRYIKYKAFLSTADTGTTPALHDISITYIQPIVLPSVATGNATLVEETTATLHGTVTDDGGEACQYRFQYGTASGVYSTNTTWTGSKTSGEPFSAGITILGEGTKYYFRAQAKNSAGTASGSELSFLTKPDEPVSFSAVAVSSTQIDLSWAKGDGAERTMVRRKTGSFPASITDGNEVYFDTGTSTSDTGLSADINYYYSAWSEVTGSDQQWSDAYATANATTGSAPPPPPPTAIGGILYPVNKARVLAPWLGLFLVLSLAMGTIIFGLRKRGLASLLPRAYSR